MIFKVLYLIVNLASIVVGQLSEGDFCYHDLTKAKGLCINIKECPEALKAIKRHEHPQRCGFDGLEVIICCQIPKINGTEKNVQKQEVKIELTQKQVVKEVDQRLEDKKEVVKSRIPGEMCKKKCKEYNQYVWKKELNPTLIGGPSDDILTLECPYNRETLIVGGKPADRREFPHMVHLGYDLGENNRTWACGGSLISDQYVLTAAHCVDSIQLKEAKFARMGIVDQDDDDHIQIFNIIERKPYPDYNPALQYHDIAVLKLDKKARLNTWVRPACIYTIDSSPHSNVIASGWGDTFAGGTDSKILQKVVLELYGPEYCNKIFKNDKKLKSGVNDSIIICAGSSEVNKDTCQGDSGGPLQIYKEEKDMKCMYDILGITSTGGWCAIAPDIPAIYTRVSHYIKWIEDIVWPETENLNNTNNLYNNNNNNNTIHQ